MSTMGQMTKQAMAESKALHERAVREIMTWLGKDRELIVDRIHGDVEYLGDFTYQVHPDAEPAHVLVKAEHNNVYGNFFLETEWMESFPDDIPIYIEDLKDEIFQDLRSNPEYSFVSDLNDESHRFNIHFAGPMATQENELIDHVHIYTYEKTIYINLPKQIRGDIFVFNMLGEQVTQYGTATGLVQIPVQADNSCFIVKVMMDSGLKSVKVFIR